MAVVRVHMSDQFTMDDGTVLYNLHMPWDCRSPCTIHAPSFHHMRNWPLLWRGDRRIFERTCPHGIGHPDPDTPSIIDTVHGCDGCCTRSTDAVTVQP